MRGGVLRAEDAGEEIPGGGAKCADTGAISAVGNSRTKTGRHHRLGDFRGGDRIRSRQHSKAIGQRAGGEPHKATRRPLSLRRKLQQRQRQKKLQQSKRLWRVQQIRTRRKKTEAWGDWASSGRTVTAAPEDRSRTPQRRFSD